MPRKLASQAFPNSVGRCRYHQMEFARAVVGAGRKSTIHRWCPECWEFKLPPDIKKGGRVL